MYVSNDILTYMENKQVLLINRLKHFKKYKDAKNNYQI